MKHIGFRRMFPRISYVVRWYLVQLMLNERRFERASCDEQAKMIAAKLERRLAL